MWQVTTLQPSGYFGYVGRLSVIGKKKIDEIDDRTLIFAEVARKAMSHMRNILKKKSWRENAAARSW